jgi:hypothetical protein
MSDPVEEGGMNTPMTFDTGDFWSLATDGTDEPTHYLFVTGQLVNGASKGILYAMFSNHSARTSFRGFTRGAGIWVRLAQSEVPGGVKANIARKLPTGQSFEDFSSNG